MNSEIPVPVPSEAMEKIYRANHHLNELRHILDEIPRGCPTGLMFDYNHETKDIIYFLEDRQFLETNLPPIVGDIIHNLRSSLDILIFKLTSPPKNKESKVQFPLSNDSGGGDLEKKIEKHGLRALGPNFEKALRSLEPWPNGRYFLWELHKLDIIDKHRSILTTVEAAQISISDLSAIIRTDGLMHNAVIEFNKGSRLLVNPASQTGAENLSPTSVYPKESVVQPKIVIRFGKNGILDGNELFPTLQSMCARTCHCLNYLTQSCRHLISTG